MRKWILLLALVGVAASAHGQSIAHGSGDPRLRTPETSCNNWFYVDDLTQTLYVAGGSPCTWAPASGGGGGGGLPGWTTTGSGASQVDTAPGIVAAGGAVAVGMTPPSGAPTGAIYQANTPYKLNGSRSAYAGAGLGYAYAMGMSTFNGDADGTTFSPLSEWNPTSPPNMTQWLNLAASNGAKYAVLYANWYDGFALWPTKVAVSGHPPYSIASTTWWKANGRPDYMQQFVTQARSLNLGVVVYLNFHSTAWETYTGTTPATNPGGYRAMILATLNEILTNYGPIDAIWVDGWTWTGYNAYLPYQVVRDYVRGLQPNCLLIDNVSHTHPAADTDVEVWESTDIPTNNTRWAEMYRNISKSKQYIFDCSNFPTAYLAQEIDIGQVARYAVQLSFTPGTDGAIASCYTTAAASVTAALPTYSLNNVISINAAVTTSPALSVTGTSSAYLTDGWLNPLSYQNTYVGYTVTGTWISDNSTLSPYAEIDLGTAQNIAEVDLWNGPDTNQFQAWQGLGGGRMRDLVVTIYDASHTLLYTSAVLNPNNTLAGGSANYATGPQEIVLPSLSVAGRYVRVTRNGTALTDNGTQLALSEIVVKN